MTPHRDFSNHLERRDDGIWYADTRESVSYLENGNDICFELEEASFWFQHRSACVVGLVERFAPAGTIYDIGGGKRMRRSLTD
jgi:hypothetical protein